MIVEKVSAEWIKNQVFILKDRHDFPIIMTQPQGVNGADLLPLSLIGCAAWDLQSILSKQRQQIMGIKLTAESDRENNPPWRFRKIHVLYCISGYNINETLVKRAIDLTENKYCSIFATLREAIDIESSYIILAPEPRQA